VNFVAYRSRVKVVADEINRKERREEDGGELWGRGRETNSTYVKYIYIPYWYERIK
jgi:hypothetical protein